MNLTLRPGTSADTERCGTICYEAFKAIADRHQFPPDFPRPQAAVASTERRFSHASYYAVVAEIEGRIVGSVFLDERSPIASVASITVDPAAQNRIRAPPHGGSSPARGRASVSWGAADPGRL